MLIQLVFCCHCVWSLEVLNNFLQRIEQSVRLLRLDYVPSEDDAPRSGLYCSSRQLQRIAFPRQLLCAQRQHRDGCGSRDLLESLTGVERLYQVCAQLSNDTASNEDLLLQVFGRIIVASSWVHFADQ